VLEHVACQLEEVPDLQQGSELSMFDYSC